MMKATFTFIGIVAPAAALADAPDPAHEAEDDEIVVVTATRTPTRLSDAPVATEVITRQDVEASGAVTLEQLLETIPGLQLLDGRRGPGLSMRGHDPAHTLILVDGRRAVGRVGGGLDLRRFTTDRIERVEIVRGPTSALYGADALGGVVHIVTRGADAPWSVELSGVAGGHVGPVAQGPSSLRVDGVGTGLDQAGGDVAVGFMQGRVRGRAAVGVHALDGWDRDPATAATDGDAQRIITPSARLAVETGRGELVVDVDGALQDGRGVDQLAAGAVIDRLHRTTTWAASVGGRFTLPREVGLDVLLEGSLYDDQVRQDQRRSDALDDFERTREALGRLVVQADGWVDADRRHQLVGGAEVMLEDVATERIEEGRAGRQRGAVFLQHQWRAADRPGLVVLTGVRLDGDSLFGVFPAPRVALRLDPHDVVRLRVAGGLGFRAPDFKQLYLDFANPGVGYRVAGDPDLRPERSYGATVDLEVRPHRLVEVTLSGWHDTLRDLIDTDLATPVGGGATVVYRYVNVGRARVQGLTGGLAVGRPSLVQARLSYTFTDADDLDHHRPLAGRAAHQASARLVGSHDRIGLSWSVGATALGPRPYHPTPDTVVLSAWSPLLDARVAWRATEQLELFVGVDNALDTGGDELDPTRPRRVYGGVDVRLSPRGGTP